MKKLLILFLFISSVAKAQTVPLKQITGLYYNVVTYGATPNNAGDDDGDNIQSAINACIAAGGGTVYFPRGIYHVSTALQTNVGGVNPNCQIYIPYESPTSANRSSITLLGEVPPNGLPASYFIDNGPSTSGSIIISTITGSGTAPAIFGTRGTDVSVNYINFTDVHVKNLTVLVPPNIATSGPTIGGFNLGKAANTYFEDVTVSINGSIFTSVLPTNEVAGIIGSLSGAEFQSSFKNTFATGFRYGLVFGEHTVLSQSGATACYAGIVPTFGNHIVKGDRISIHWSVYSVYVPNTTILGIAPGNAYVGIDQLNLELNDPDLPWGASNRWFDFDTVVYDPGNYLDGYINYHIVQAGVGPLNSLFNISAANTKLQTVASTLSQNFKETAENTLTYTQSPATGAVSATLRNLTNSTASSTSFRVNNDANYTNQFGIYSQTTTPYGAIGSNWAYMYTNADGFAFLTDIANKPILFAAGGNTATAQLLSTEGINYLNLGSIAGSTGYGIRDNAGILEHKNSGGSWVGLASGASQWTTTGSNIYYNTGNVGIGSSTVSAPLFISKSITAGYGQMAIKDPVNSGDQAIIYQSFRDADNVRLAVVGFGHYLGGTDANYYFANEITGGGFIYRNTSADIAHITSSGNLLLPTTSAYLNFSATEGTTGFGIRNNSGAMEFKNSGGSWAAFGSGTSLSLAAFGSTPNANGLTLASSVLNMEPASVTQPGGVSIAAQEFNGAKTFDDAAIFDAGLTSYTNNLFFLGIDEETDDTYSLLVANDGDNRVKYKNFILKDGVYTPTLTNTQNVAASSVSQCRYQRVGNTVTVTGRLVIDPTSAAAQVYLEISLPIATTFADSDELAGVAAAWDGTPEAVAIYSEATNETALVSFVPSSAASKSYSFTFTYRL